MSSEFYSAFIKLLKLNSIAAGMLKPNLLKHSDYMTECCGNLKEAHEFDSDAKVDRLIAIRRIDDQVHAAFYVEDALDLPITDARISMNLRFMSSQLEDWKREHYINDVPRVLHLSHSFTEMSLHAVGLRSPSPSSQPGSDFTQINALVTCLEAGRRFFDAILQTPVSEYHYISMSEWMRLPLVVITMARICMPSETNATIQWDVTAAQDRCRLDLYLESLCYRMQSLSTYDTVKQNHPDFWAAMRMIMELTRTWYCRKIRTNTATASTQPNKQNLPTPNTTSASSGADYPDMSNMHHANGPSVMGNYSLGAMSNSMDIVPDDSDPTNGAHDPFAFMKEADFNMDQFFDMGIWGNESYEGMGFGQSHQQPSMDMSDEPNMSMMGYR